MAPPTRAEYLRSTFHRCALVYYKRKEERLNNMRALLEKHEKLRKMKQGLKERRKYKGMKLPPIDNPMNGFQNSRLNANMENSEWHHDEESDEYILFLDDQVKMKLPASMFKRLKDFQRDAVKWVASIQEIGGILADDMGLGKTVMAVASLGGLMRVKKIQMALVVAPLSVLAGWEEEAKKVLPKFAPSVRVMVVHKGTAKERQMIMRNAWKSSSLEQPYVIISTWGLVTSEKTVSTFLPPSGHHWSFVTLDEAHIIKNHNSPRWSICRRICHKPGTSRLLLTGTPFQNNTDELWSVISMATAGQVLGKIKDFNKEFGKAIKNMRCRNAPSYVLSQGEKANVRLQEKLKPFLLRREKMDYLAEELPPKHDICIWVRPSTHQTRMYQDIINSNTSVARSLLSKDKAAAQNARMCAFNVINNLRKICGHPLRMHGRDGCDVETILKETAVGEILNGSDKLKVALHLLEGFRKDGLRTLLFSQSTEMLDIIQDVLNKKGAFHVARLDGSVSETKRRLTVELFQNGEFDVFLLSTGAGGVGLTLTRATRVIVFDPSWNPSVDAQAVDRVYRIKQTHEVRVYRLFLAGSVEEKIYEKQTHKDGIQRTIFTEGSQGMNRLWDKRELSKVFAQIPNGSCDLLEKFGREGIAQVPDIHRHDLVRKHSSVIGISNHAGVYKGKRKGAFKEANTDSKRIRLAIDLDE